MLVVMSIDHHGKPHPNLEDRGAIGHDGLSEVCYTGKYVWGAEKELRKAGAKVVVISDGRYYDRWVRADAMNADCYISCHMNAGGGDRGEVYYDYRTSPDNGVALSRSISRSLDDRVPWGVESKGAGAGDRAFRCIEGLKTVGIVYEPAFLDGPRGVLLEYTRSMARGLAEGVIAWAWSR